MRNFNNVGNLDMRSEWKILKIIFIHFPIPANIQSSNCWLLVSTNEADHDRRERYSVVPLDLQGLFLELRQTYDLMSSRRGRE